MAVPETAVKFLGHDSQNDLLAFICLDGFRCFSLAVLWYQMGAWISGPSDIPMLSSLPPKQFCLLITGQR